MAADYFNCEDTPINCAFMRKTMIGLVARARRPGCKFDTIAVTGGLRCPDLNQRHPAFISSWVALCCRAKYGRLSAGKVGEGQQIGL